MENARSTTDELRAFAHYARRLRSYLRETIEPTLARNRIAAQLGRRTESFLGLVENGVYANPGSPYRKLLEIAGAELGDVRKLVEEGGLEHALSALRDAGVYVTLAEFKGRAPIERRGVALRVDPSDFDNPIAAPHFWAQTSGSRGPRRRVPLDLGLIEHDAAHEAVFRDGFDAWDRPFALWRVKPPSTSGINNALRQVKIGRSVEKWFNPYRPSKRMEALKYSLFTTYTIASGRLHGARLALPEYRPVDEAAEVARWLAASRRAGSPALLDAQAGLGVRICHAAAAAGIDISGTLFRFGGEPLTQAKARAVGNTGSRVVSHYSMVETGRVAMACPGQATLDDLHFLSEKLAVLQHGDGSNVPHRPAGALSYTTLLPFSPKIMINVESGDYGVLEERSCGCPWDEIGLSLHLSEVRSYEKLTSEGNHFLGSDVFTLVEEALPGRFGGGPTDYQLVEEEVDGLPKVSVVIRPALGAIADREVLSAVLEFLSARPENRLMADFWRQSETVQVVRREPYVTATGKTPPLYVHGVG